MIYGTIDKSAESLDKKLKKYSWYSHIGIDTNSHAIIVYTKDLAPAIYRNSTQYDDWLLKFRKIVRLESR